MKRFVLVGLVAVLVSACGATAPSEASVAGTWTGDFLSTQSSDQSEVAFTMTLTQTGSSVSGTWGVFDSLPFLSVADGTVSGTVTTTTFSGTFTLNSTDPNHDNGFCTATFAASGNAGGTTMNWTGSSVTGNCTNLPTNITINVHIE